MPLLVEAAEKNNIRAGAYANSFAAKIQTRDQHAADDTNFGYRQDLHPMDYSCVVEKWIHQGAQIVGGCCGIFPEHIQRMKALINQRHILLGLEDEKRFESDDRPDLRPAPEMKSGNPNALGWESGVTTIDEVDHEADGTQTK